MLLRKQESEEEIFQEEGRKKSSKKAGAGGAGPRPFPAETLEEAIRIPQLIRELNGGNPWPPAEVARALVDCKVKQNVVPVS